VGSINTSNADNVQLAYRMWGLAALFYVFDFFQRVSPASLAFDLSREIAPTALALGTLSSAYFLTYAGFQLPAGLLVDRLGARKVLTMAAIGGGAGVAVFALAPMMEQAILGRLILGATGAVAWIALLKLASEWFSPQRFAGITGLSLAMGAVGAVLAGFPLSRLADIFGWREVLLGSSSCAILLALLFWWLIRDRPDSSRSVQPSATLTQPISLLALPWRSLIILGLGQMGVTGSMAALSWLWSVPYLKTGFSLSASTATLLSSCMMIFFALGGVAFGRWSDRLQERRRPLMLGTVGVVLMLALLSTGALSDNLMATTACLWLMGLSAGSMVLSFAAAKDVAQGHHTGAVVAFMNLCVMTGSIGLPPLFGTVLDAQWQGSIIDGVRRYPIEAYELAFQGLAVWVLLTLLFQWRWSDALIDAKVSAAKISDAKKREKTTPPQ
jgi:MFS family permease